MSDLLVTGGRLVGLDGSERQDILIQDGKVTAVGASVSPPEGIGVLDAAGLLVFPGLIDSQVHFREPGAVHKEDLESGSLAAVAGGVTSFLEMPNTKPATTDPERLQQKLDLAAGRVHADHAFFLGATAENAERLGEWEQLPGCAGVKVFMGSSTGDLLVPDDETLERVLRSGSRRVAVHSEDEERLRQRYAKVDPQRGVEQHPDVRDVLCALRATQRLLDLVEKTGRKVHVLHLSTAEEVDLLRERDLGDLVTAEVTPNHLFLTAPDCYQRFGTGAQMNPPVRDQRHREVLRQALVEGVIACIGSDHAPHTQEEKDRPYPESPAGIPGVQTILPLLLGAVHEGWLRHQDIVRICCAAPADIYTIHHKGPVAPGVDGDLVLVDPNVCGTLPADWLRSRAGQSPYVGMPLHGWPTTTVLRGNVVYRDHGLVADARGRPLLMA